MLPTGSMHSGKQDVLTANLNALIYQLKIHFNFFSKELLYYLVKLEHLILIPPPPPPPPPIILNTIYCIVPYVK